MSLWISALLLVHLLTLLRAATIVPGATWTDTDGNIIQAHGGGFLRVNDTIYWFGEDKVHNTGRFRAVACYSSTDMATWTRHNDALKPIEGTMISTSNILERPKVLYNRKNSEYVMWFHSDSSNYGAAMLAGDLAAKSPEIWDCIKKMTVTHMFYSSDNNQNFKIVQLDDDYYNVTNEIKSINGQTLESPAIIKKNGRYYLFASHTTGWAPNPNKWLSATSLGGSWSAERDLAPSETRTYYSQTTYVMPLGNDAIYMGDRWRSAQLGGSRYVWLPMSFASGSPSLVWADVWTLNITAGTYTVHAGKSYEAESGTVAGSARLASSSRFSGGRIVGYLGNGGSVSLTGVTGAGRDQWVSVYYANGDSSYRNITISVNGGASVLLDMPDTSSSERLLSQPVKLRLSAGANNLTFGAGQRNYGGDLDRVIVYEQA